MSAKAKDGGLVRAEGPSPLSSSSSPTSPLRRSVRIGADRERSPVDMPCFGLGLSHNNGGWSSDVVVEALRLGVRLFDTASRYGNESQLGDLLREAGRDANLCGTRLTREELFISTKFFPSELEKFGSISADIEQGLRSSLKRLGMDYVDLYLLHWPGGRGKYASIPPADLRRAMWVSMLRVKQLGLARCVGVSNFETRHLEDLLAMTNNSSLCRASLRLAMMLGGDASKSSQLTASTSSAVDERSRHQPLGDRLVFEVPSINQFEINPMLPNQNLVEFCQHHHIVIEGYCPFAKGAAFRHPPVQRIAAAARYVDVEDTDGSASSDPVSVSSSLKVSSRKQQAAEGKKEEEGTNPASSVSIAALLIQWSMYHVGAITIPKTCSISHLRSNIMDGLGRGRIDSKSLEALSTTPGVDVGLRSTWNPVDVD